MASATEVEVEGRRVRVSNLDKLLYPDGTSKGEVIDYYSRIAPVLLDHLRGRPLTMLRYPDGVEGKRFYEKQCPSHRPDWVRTTPIDARGEGRFGHTSTKGPRTIDFCLVDDLPTLVWVANLASLELHVTLARAEAIDCPTAVVFDLDPGEPAGLAECAQVGLLVRDLLAGLGLECAIKTSGSTGLQVYLPLNTEVTYEQTTPFAKAVAGLLEREHPKLVVSRQAKDLRKGKVLVDWSQNVDFKTTVCAYSLRARERPTISAPLAWDEVEGATTRGAADRLRFEPADVLDRVATNGDLFRPSLEVEQQLPALS